MTKNGICAQVGISVRESLFHLGCYTHTMKIKRHFDIEMQDDCAHLNERPWADLAEFRTHPRVNGCPPYVEIDTTIFPFPP